MLSYTWNAAWEASPSNSLSRNSLDDHLRRITGGLRERMEREHNWGPFTDSDDGSHIAGKTTVLLTGDAVALAAVADMQEGALFLQDDGTNLELFLYTGAAWVSITNDVHGNMENLTDDLAHEQYMLKDTAYVLEDTFDMNDQRLSTLAAVGVPLVADHPYDFDPHAVLAYTALADDSIVLLDALSTTYLVHYSGQLSRGGAAANVNLVLASDTIAVIGLRLQAMEGPDDWVVGCIPNAGYPHICIRKDEIGARICNYDIYVVTS